MKLQKGQMQWQTGFTLFELLVSISIIAIMTALATISYSNAQIKARNARRVEDMKTIQNAAEMYYSQNSYSYPGTYSSGGSWPGYLAVIPSDPKSSNPAYYFGTSNTNQYCICATMEGGTGGNSQDLTCNFVASGAYYCVKNQQ